MSREIHQLVHTLSYGDAISGEVLGLQRCLRKLGYQSEIFAIHVHPKLKGQALSYESFPKDFRGQVILHYSLGSPLNRLYLGLGKARRSLIYHNITPAHWFKGVNPRIVRDIHEGIQELPDLLRVTDRILADSPFNASEIEKLGFQAEVLELPIDPSRWEQEQNPGIATLVRSTPGIHMLHVGRLAPNKCVEDIIKTFYFLHHFINKQSLLWLVGIDIDTELYSFSLKRLVNELGLSEAVNFAGCLADSEVQALYRNASVYMCMSEHEGFCLPVVEAMHFGLPVICYDSSALADTVAQGGVLVKHKRHAELAELVNEICTNLDLRQALVSAGKKRVSELSFGRFEDQVQELFQDASSTAAA